MCVGGVSGSALGGGGCLLGGGLSAPGGGGGLSAPRGCLLQEVSAPGGVSGIPTCTEADTPPVDRITDACKNITLAKTSLRPVIIDKIGIHL